MYTQQQAGEWNTNWYVFVTEKFVCFCVWTQPRINTLFSRLRKLFSLLKYRERKFYDEIGFEICQINWTFMNWFMSKKDERFYANLNPQHLFSPYDVQEILLTSLFPFWFIDFLSKIIYRNSMTSFRSDDFSIVNFSFDVLVKAFDDFWFERKFQIYLDSSCFCAIN